MKLRIKGTALRQVDADLVEACTYYILNMFVAAKKLGNVDIQVNIIHPSTIKNREDREDLIEYSAWMYDDGYRNAVRKFSITVDSTLIRKTRVKPIARLAYILECVIHELIHVKQYVNGELHDLPNDIIMFKGKRYKYVSEGEGYYRSPWEIEAYGLEHGLYVCFKNQLNK